VVELSVIIPHYRDIEALRLCLSSLEGQTFPRDSFEIVVADNGTPDFEALSAAVGGRARLVVIAERGAGPARNGGVAAARGNLLAFIDSDCVADPTWLSEGVAALAGYDFIGGRVKVLVRNRDRVTPVEAFERVFAFDFQSYVLRKGFTGAGNLFCRRELFEAVGGFRTGVSEDVEWSHRARDAGYSLGYAPTAVVGHPARLTWPELIGKWRRITSEMYKLAAEQPGGRLTWLLRSLLLPASAVAHSPRVLFSGELESPSQRIGALGVLFRLRMWRFALALRLLADKPEQA
jgi:GT2 family glycosyltransferase